MVITKATEVRPENINWVKVGERFRFFRKACDLSPLATAEALKVTEGAITNLESGHIPKSANVIWTAVRQWDISLNWLLNGIGEPKNEDPITLLPETLMLRKGAGFRRLKDRNDAEEGSYTDEVLEFVTAIDKFKLRNQIPFPSFTQIYEIVLALGYRKCLPQRIAPLGYKVYQQKIEEKLKQLPMANIIDVKQEGFLKEHARRKKISKAQRGRARIKKYLVTDPDGRQYVTYQGMTEFCRQHQLISQNMFLVVRGKRRHHRGWKAEYLSKEMKTALEKIQTKALHDAITDDNDSNQT